MQRQGLSRDDALRCFAMLDGKGLLGEGREVTDSLRSAMAFARSDISDGTPLEAAIEAFKPTVLLGLTTVHGLFTERVLTLMGKLNDRPIIMPLSNPTSRSECTAEEAAAATGGRAIFGAWRGTRKFSGVSKCLSKKKIFTRWLADAISRCQRRARRSRM